MPRKSNSQQLPLFPPPAGRPATKKTRRAEPKKTSGRRPARASGRPADLLKEIAPDILQKMADLARQGDVRAAALILKLLEKNEPDDNPDSSLTSFKRQLFSIEQTLVSEIISLLAEGDSRAKALPDERGDETRDM